MEQVYRENGQGQVLKYINELQDTEKDSFLKQLESVDPKTSSAIFTAAVNAPEVDKSVPKPPPASSVGSRIDADTKVVDAWTKKGLEAIGRGEIGVVLMAGGQGTRLGSSAPKGCYDIQLPSHKSLFQLQAERLVKVSELGGGRVPWYIMTSGPTREATESFFKEHNYFGLNKEDVIIFEQGVLPCYSNDGKFLLESKGVLATAPGGNGGIYDAMRAKQLDGGASVMSDMNRRGIKYVHTYGVDNCLVRIADPAFMGYCIDQEAEIGAKVVRKRSPHEPVGVVALPDGEHFGILEYSEISKDLAEAIDPSNGQLLFRAANIVNHFFSVAFLERLEAFQDKMYYHIARKKIPSIDYGTDQFVKPTSPNGIKLELFVFDVFPFSSRVSIFEVDRAHEFSPLKNAPGTGEDDPETSRADLLREHKSWLTAVGATVDGDVEISPRVSYAGEGLSQYKGKTVSGLI